MLFAGKTSSLTGVRASKCASVFNERSSRRSVSDFGELSMHDPESNLGTVDATTVNTWVLVG